MLTPPGSRETAGSTGGPWWWWGGRERDEAGVATAAGGRETRGRGEEAGAQVVREKGLETETGSGGAGGQRQRGRTGSKGLAEGQRGRCTRKVVGVEVGCRGLGQEGGSRLRCTGWRERGGQGRRSPADPSTPKLRLP